MSQGFLNRYKREIVSALLAASSSFAVSFGLGWYSAERDVERLVNADRRYSLSFDIGTLDSVREELDENVQILSTEKLVPAVVLTNFDLQTAALKDPEARRLAEWFKGFFGVAYQVQEAPMPDRIFLNAAWMLPPHSSEIDQDLRQELTRLYRAINQVNFGNREVRAILSSNVVLLPKAAKERLDKLIATTERALEEVKSINITAVRQRVDGDSARLRKILDSLPR